MKLLKSIIISSFFFSLVSADQIKIHNYSPRDLYVGIYYLRTQAELASTIYFIQAGNAIEIERPDYKFLYDRELVFSEEKEHLRNTLPKCDLEKYNAKNIGYSQGNVIYIADKNGEFKGYNQFEWYINKHIIDQARSHLMNTIPAIMQNPYENKTASVRTGNGLPAQEKEFLKKRKPKVKTALERMLNRSLEGKRIPTIAILLSGGGFRAMFYSLSALFTAQEFQLLQSTTYIASLSGSCWGVAAWMASQMPLNTFYTWFAGQFESGITDISSADANLIADALATKYFFDQPIGPVDVYGALIANCVFKELDQYKQRATLSQQADRIAQGDLPMPIYTAVRAESGCVENMWYEFTPYEVGGAWLSSYVPTWAFGRKFSKGISLNFAPELSLGNLMGIWGFVFGFNFSRALKEIELKNKVTFALGKNLIDKIEQEFGENRFLKAEVPNFTFNMPQSPIKNQNLLSLTDAGISFILPYPPISGQRPERKADIIIIIDASSGNLSSELKNVENYARLKQLPFPKIDCQDIETKAISIFKDEMNSQAPLVIYMPRVISKQLIDRYRNNREFKSLIELIEHINLEQYLETGPFCIRNFAYTHHHVQQLSAIARFNMLTSKDTIVKEINWKIDRMFDY
jgi:phospholipase A2